MNASASALARPRIADYETFWPFYLGEHSQWATKVLHAVGTGVSIACTLIAVPATRHLAFMPLGFAIGYAFAWTAHFVVEKNRPATFQYPFWSFFADLEMFSMMVCGWMDVELERIARDPGARVSPPRQAWRWTLRVVFFAYVALLGALWHLGWLAV